MKNYVETVKSKFKLSDYGYKMETAFDAKKVESYLRDFTSVVDANSYDDTRNSGDSGSQHSGDSGSQRFGDDGFEYSDDDDDDEEKNSGKSSRGNSSRNSRDSVVSIKSDGNDRLRKTRTKRSKTVKRKAEVVEKPTNFVPSNTLNPGNISIVRSQIEDTTANTLSQVIFAS